MKVNGIDARKYDAKQLGVVITPPSISLKYEMLTAALIPTEFATDIPLSHLKLTMYFKGENRNAINRSMSSFMANFTKSCVLELNGYKGRFKGYTTGDDYEDTISQKRKKLNIEFDGYFYDDEIKIIFDEINLGQISTIGSRPAPCIVEVYAKSDLTDYRISGFGSEDIVIKNLGEGKTIIIDGIKGVVSMGEKNAFEDVDLWEFPFLKVGTTNLFFSEHQNAKITIRYMPMWL